MFVIVLRLESGAARCFGVFRSRTETDAIARELRVMNLMEPLWDSLEILEVEDYEQT